jgi:pilus assembly protein Flp/PilA
MLEKIQFMAIMFVGDLKTKATQRDERGATAVEYGLMVALIAAVIIAGVTLLGQNLQDLFDSVAGTISGP